MTSHPTRPTRLRRGRWIGLGLLVLVAVAGWLFRSRLLSPVGPYLNDPSPEVSAELGFLLGGGRSTRADLAASLYKQGKIQRILVSGAGPTADVDGVRLLSEQQILEGMLRALGVPEDAIVPLPDVVASTRDEAEALRRFLARRPAETVAIITSDYHTRRCRWIFSHALRGTAVRVQFVGAPGEVARPEEWWKNSEGRIAYGLEAIKLVPAWFATLW